MAEAAADEAMMHASSGSVLRSLRDVRAEQLLSIRELSQRANVAPSTIYMIEVGRSVPRFSVARRIADALGVNPHTVEEFRRSIQAHGGLR
jgi:DNA-binding XRE family transcriptional regulator